MRGEVRPARAIERRRADPSIECERLFVSQHQFAARPACARPFMRSVCCSSRTFAARTKDHPRGLYLGGSFVDDAVWIKGTRLREAREAAHLRLADVAGGIMSPGNLSRIERHERYRLPLSAMASLGRRLGLVLGNDLDSQVWARAAGGTAIDLLSQWRFSEALSVLRLRDAVVTSEDPVTEL